jgi:hypothetical protein
LGGRDLIKGGQQQREQYNRIGMYLCVSLLLVLQFFLVDFCTEQYLFVFCDCMVVGITTTCTFSAYHYQFDPHSGEVYSI